MSHTSDNSSKPVKSASNGTLSYADAIAQSTAGAQQANSNVITTQLHASLLPRALSYGSQQSSASGNAPKDVNASASQTAAAKQRTSNALAAVNSKLDKQASQSPPVETATAAEPATQSNGIDNKTNDAATTAVATDNTASKSPPVGSSPQIDTSAPADTVSTATTPTTTALQHQTSDSSPRARGNAQRQSGGKPKNQRKYNDPHSANNSPRYANNTMFDYNIQRQLSNPNMQPNYYRQPSGGRVPQYMPQQPYMYPVQPQYYVSQAADMMQLQAQMQALGRQSSNTQTTSINTTASNSPRSAQAQRSLPLTTATGSPITPTQPPPNRRVSSSNSPLLSGPAQPVQPVLSAAPAGMQIPAGYYFDPRYQAFVAAPPLQMPYNVPAQYYQQALQQQQLRYPQPLYNTQPQLAYMQPQQFTTQQPMVVALAKYPPQPSSFPPSTVATMPSFTTLVIPNPGQTPSQPPDKQQMYFSIDVECVATGTGHNDRAVGSIAVVDMHENVVLNVVVKPNVPVVSCLTALTGLQPHQINAGVTLEQALLLVKNVITRDSLIVGQNILKDINWLGLQEGADYHSLCDLAGCYRVYNPQYQNYSAFSLSHVAKSLLGLIQAEPHHAADDAYLSVKLYALHRRLTEKGNEELKRQADDLLLNTPQDSSFSKRFPEIDGVCLGGKKTCKCGQAFLF